MKRSIVALLIGLGGIAVLAILAAVSFGTSLEWRLSFEKTYYERTFPTGKTKSIITFLYRHSGAKDPSAEVKNYNEAIVSGLPATFLAPGNYVTVPQPILASVWYYEPAFGIKGEDAYMVDVFVEEGDTAPATVSFTNGKAVNLRYVFEGQYGNVFGHNNPSAQYGGSESDWQTLVTPNNQPYGGAQLVLVKISYYTGTHAGYSYYVLSKSVRR